MNIKKHLLNLVFLHGNQQGQGHSQAQAQGGTPLVGTLHKGNHENSERSSSSTSVSSHTLVDGYVADLKDVEVDMPVDSYVRHTRVAPRVEDQRPSKKDSNDSAASVATQAHASTRRRPRSSSVSVSVISRKSLLYQ